MHRFLSGAALSALFVAGNMAPVLANTTNINTDAEVTAHSVEVTPDLVEIEGRTLTDAEAAMIEGEGAFVVAPAVLLVLLKAAAASATKKAVIGVGMFALRGAIKGGKFVVTSAAGAVIGQYSLSQLQRLGFRF